VLQLKATLFTIGIDIVRDGRAFQPNRGGEDVYHGAMQTRGPLLGQFGRNRAGVDARLKQRFIGVDVAHSAHERLVQQERLDTGVAFFQAFKKILEWNIQRVRPQRLSAIEQSVAPGNLSEMADIVVHQHALIEFEDRAGVRARLRIE